MSGNSVNSSDSIFRGLPHMDFEKIMIKTFKTFEIVNYRLLEKLPRDNITQMTCKLNFVITTSELKHFFSRNFHKNCP